MKKKSGRKPSARKAAPGKKPTTKTAPPVKKAAPATAGPPVSHAPEDRPRQTYTLVYRNRLVQLDPQSRQREVLERGEYLELSSKQYEQMSRISRRALVLGKLTAVHIHVLLEQSKGVIPEASMRHQVAMTDFATGHPVKGQESQATTTELSLPNFVPMSSQDIREWAALQSWITGPGLPNIFEGLEKKPDLVAAVKDLADEITEREKPTLPGLPGSEFRDA